MKIYAFLFLFAFMVSCGGSLSNEERKKLHEGKELQEIKKISEAEIFEAALENGRHILSEVENYQTDQAKLDSLGNVYHATIHLLEPGKSEAKIIEQQLIEAYLSNAVQDEEDNIQKAGTDSLLYTKPIIRKDDDGVESITGMWSIWLSKKHVILSMDDN